MQLSSEALPGLRETFAWATASADTTARRTLALLTLVDRAGPALDDIAELRKSIATIAGNLERLSSSAAGIDNNAGEIAKEISGLSGAAQGIDVHAEKLAESINALVDILPTLRRLTEIVDPLDNTVVRLGRFVDRLPGGGRRTQRAVESNP